jgi:hypothetical protein
MGADLAKGDRSLFQLLDQKGPGDIDHVCGLLRGKLGVDWN